MPSSMSPALALTFQRLFPEYTEAATVAAILLECVRSNEADWGMHGLYFTDSASSTLSFAIQSEVIPFIRAAGGKVAYCNLKNVSAVDAAVLVYDEVAALANMVPPGGHESLCFRNRRSLGLYSVDDAKSAVTARMILAAIAQGTSDVIVIIDAVEQLLSDIEGRSLLAGLQDARELVSSCEETIGNFLLVGIGTDDATLDRLAKGKYKPARRRPNT
jgi:hypothetical protein